MKKNEVFISIIMALCELILGVLLLINPIGFTSLVFIILGIVLAIMGITEIIVYFRTEPVYAILRQNLAVGLAETVAGLFCIFQYKWLIAAFPLLTMLYGVLILATGFAKIQWTADMLRLKQKYWYLAALNALLSTVFALTILSNPFSSIAVLWIFVAVSLIVEAVADVAVLFFRKRNQHVGADTDK